MFFCSYVGFLTAKEKPEEESRHHHSDGQRSAQRIISRLCRGSAATRGHSHFQAAQKRGAAARFPAFPGRQFGIRRDSSTEAARAAEVLCTSRERDAVQETRLVRLALLQTCWCHFPGTSWLLWHYQAPHGSQHYQGDSISIDKSSNTLVGTNSLVSYFSDTFGGLVIFIMKTALRHQHVWTVIVSNRKKWTADSTETLKNLLQTCGWCSPIVTSTIRRTMTWLAWRAICR